VRNTPLDRDFEQLGIIFIEEHGMDASGSRRSFFRLMAEELCKLYLNLLSFTDDGRYEVMSGSLPELYSLLGRLITFSLVNKDVFPITFDKPFYKQLIDAEVDDHPVVDLQYDSYLLQSSNSVPLWRGNAQRRLSDNIASSMAVILGNHLYETR
jgi:hypothetical protein